MPQLRAITLNEKCYLWGVRTAYVRNDTSQIEYTTHVRFVAYLEGRKGSPLTVHFQTREDARAGNPLTSVGAIITNLNTPRPRKGSHSRGHRKGLEPAVGREHLRRRQTAFGACRL